MASPSRSARPASRLLRPSLPRNPLPPNPPVPYQRFYREKQRRQELASAIETSNRTIAEKDAALASLNEKWARLEERLNIFRQAAEAEQPGQPAQPQAPPNPEEDPIGYIKWLG